MSGDLFEFMKLTIRGPAMGKQNLGPARPLINWNRFGSLQRVMEEWLLSPCEQRYKKSLGKELKR